MKTKDKGKGRGDGGSEQVGRCTGKADGSGLAVVIGDLGRDASPFVEDEIQSQVHHQVVFLLIVIGRNSVHSVLP